MNGQEVLASLAVAVGLLWVSRPLVAAVARRIGGEAKPAVPPELVDDLRVELEDTRGRLAAVEERLDFTERMLAKQREADRLALRPER